MNTIVRELKAEALPAELRGDIDPQHVVRVTVTDIGVATPPRRTPEELFEMLDRVSREHGDPNATIEDAVARVRALRDEWD